MAKIHWNKVTWYSKLLAVILFLAIFAWAFHLGRQYEQVYERIAAANAPATSTVLGLVSENLIANAVFTCDSDKAIQAQFMQNTIGQGSVALELSDGRSLVLPQAMSADGARYAKPDGSFVFWDKGNGSFIEEGAPYATNTPETYSNCVTAQ
jgi:membrane-bound inhibitor of C-type lysozyme